MGGGDGCGRGQTKGNADDDGDSTIVGIEEEDRVEAVARRVTSQLEATEKNAVVTWRVVTEQSKSNQHMVVKTNAERVATVS